MKRKKITLIFQLLNIVRPMTGAMMIATLLGVLGFMAAIFIPILAGIGLVEVYSKGMVSMYLVLLIALLALSRGFLRYGEQACNHYVAFKILAIIRDKLFTVLRKLAPAKLEGKDKGNLISLLTSDIELLEVFYAHTITPVCIAILSVMILTLFIGNYHPLLGIVALIGYASVGVGVPYFISQKAQIYGTSLREQIGDISSTILDNLRGINESIQYNCGEEKLSIINQLTDDMSKKEKQLKIMNGKSTAITNALVLIFGMIMLFTSSLLNSQGLITMEAVIIMTIAMLSSFGPVIAIANLGTGLSQTFASANRVLDLLEEEPLVQEIYGEEKILFEDFEFEKVSFGYDDKRIVQNCNFKGYKNQIIGISGKSGVGKSTILKLLMRFWDVDHGMIKISKHDIQHLKTNSLRNLESFVTQETILFNDTIENNLRIAKQSASNEEIVEACKKAAIHDFIQSLPNGYQTSIGELGSTLSSGERQRIGVARAFLHGAPIILLDEPTSNLDNLNEAIILKSLKEQNDKTIVLVSHRLSTLRIADEVITLKDGTIIYE